MRHVSGVTCQEGVNDVNVLRPGPAVTSTWTV